MSHFTLDSGRPRLRFHAAAALALLVLGGCASTQSVGTQVDDAAIKTLVIARLATNGNTNPFEIDVAVNEGVVHLTGLVDEAEDRSEAEREARSVEGVSRVINDLKVGDQTTREMIDDGGITARVKSKLAASSELNPFNVDINTVQGVVSLMGRVKTQEQKDTAERIARETSGVKSVKNLLEVGDIN